MEKITQENCFNLLKERFPKFIPYWEKGIALWGEEGMMAKMAPFSDYTVDIIKANNTSEIKNIFDFVEFLLCNGDPSVQNGVATVFLEYLLSKDPREIKFSTFCQYLGYESIEYCRAWDKFCGMKTEGLWDNEKNEQKAVGINRERGLESLLDSITSIADKEFQEKFWTQDTGPILVGFDQSTNYFSLEDLDIIENYKDFGITEKQHEMLIKLKNYLNKLPKHTNVLREEPESNATPTWEMIVETAKEVLKAFNYKKNT